MQKIRKTAQAIFGDKKYEADYTYYYEKGDRDVPPSGELEITAIYHDGFDLMEMFREECLEDANNYLKK